METIVSIFSVHMLAVAEIEVVVGLTMIGTFLAIVLLIIGNSKEKKPTEEPVDSIDENKNVEKAEPGIAQKVEKPEEAKDAPKEPEKETNEPVMAILQKPESNDKPAEGEELERQIVEKRLQRIADKQAKQKEDEPDELPAMPAPPNMTGNQSDLPPIPKPFLHELP
jgi:outer membrane biosynthesis protein TonB